LVARQIGRHFSKRPLLFDCHNPLSHNAFWSPSGRHLGRHLKTTFCSSPHQFEPLLPQKEVAKLHERSQAIVNRSLGLGERAHPTTRLALRELLRAMNSYYSNLIEGQGTTPHNIERALHKDFSKKPDVARLQRIAVAHIEAEEELEEKIQAGAEPLLSSFAVDAHRALYGRLRVGDRTTKEGVVVEPGRLREQNVDVGIHIAPTWESIPQFLARFDEVYVKERSWDDRLLAIASAHHRFAWIHPFADGNGRAARLQTHSALHRISSGLWSPNRGLARRKEEYYSRLSEADQPRRGDLDGRGNLTEAGLRGWIEFFLDVCDDQVSFMSTMLDLDNMKTRIQALITFRAAQDKLIREQAILPLFHVFGLGPLTRGEFQQMTGLGERVARSLLSRLIETGLVVSDGPYAPVRFAFPLDALQFLLPDLYPEASRKVT
jgi:Fic family protein